MFAFNYLFAMWFLIIWLLKFLLRQMQYTGWCCCPCRHASLPSTRFALGRIPQPRQCPHLPWVSRCCRLQHATIRCGYRCGQTSPRELECRSSESRIDLFHVHSGCFCKWLVTWGAHTMGHRQRHVWMHAHLMVTAATSSPKSFSSMSKWILGMSSSF